MAAITRLCSDLRNAMADAIKTLIDAGAGAGVIKIYTGSMPDHPADAITTQTLLGTLTFSDPSAVAAVDGVLTFSAITQDAAADASGTAAWARIADSDGNAILDVNVGTSDTAIVMNTVTVVAGGPIAITSFTITIPES